MPASEADVSTISITGPAGTNVRWLLGDMRLPGHIDPDRLRCAGRTRTGRTRSCGTAPLGSPRACAGPG